MPRAIFALRDCSLELSEFQIMILNLNRQTFHAGFFGQAFRDSPALEHAVFFEPEIKVMTSRVMLLDDKSRFAHSLGRLIRLLIIEDIPITWNSRRALPIRTVNDKAIEGATVFSLQDRAGWGEESGKGSFVGPMFTMF
jgi:hypothetical protein